MEEFNMQDSQIDERDYIYENVCGLAKTPDEWVSPYYPIYNQKTSMWCMAHSSTSLYSIINYMMSNGKSKIDFSKEFMMYNAKDIDGIPTTKGTTGKAICETAIKKGFCPEEYCKTTLKGELKGQITKPSQQAFNEALKYKSYAYARVSDLDGILSAIYKDCGVITSILYYASMLNSKLGYIAKPSPLDKKLGCHSTCLIGYSKNKTVNVGGVNYKGFFIQLNSYGESQGRDGLEFIPFDSLNWKGGRDQYDCDRIMREFWVLYPKKDEISNKYFADNQPKQVIKDMIPINMKLTINKDIAIIDGKSIKMDTKPIIKSGVTFLPMRFVFENMGCDVTYTKEKDGHDTIIGKDKNTASKVQMSIGYKLAYINNKEYYMLQAPYIENGRTFVPIRAIGEMLFCKVDYEPKTKTITITR